MIEGSDIPSALAGIRQAVLDDSASRDRVVGDFLRSMDTMCSRVARWANRYRGLDWGRDGDDLTQLVREVALVMVDEVIAGSDDHLVNWEAALRVRSRSAVSAYSDSGSVSGISGYTTARRRQRALAAYRSRLDSARQEPASDEEVLESYNARMRAKRSNPQKQSAFATQADLVAPASVVLGDGSDRYADAQAQADDLFGQMEASLLIEQVVEECASIDAESGEIARYWLSWYPDDVPLTTSDVVRHFDISRFKAEAGVQRAKSAFRRALIETA